MKRTIPKEDSVAEESGPGLVDHESHDNLRIQQKYSSKAKSRSNDSRVVYVVDDDGRIREALEELVTAFGLTCFTFRTAAEYLAFARPDVPSCLVLDVELTDINGLDLQGQLKMDMHPPIVFITGRGDIPKSVRAIKAGAIDFLTKPVQGAEFLKSVRKAFVQDEESRLRRKSFEVLKKRFATLTCRERDVLPLVIAGKLNRQAAAALGISVITFQIHRGRVMRKMGAQSIPDLVRIAEKLQLSLS